MTEHVHKLQGATYIQINGNCYSAGFPGGSDGKESSHNAWDLDSVPGLGRSSGEENATHSSILAWKIPWTEEFGGLQSKAIVYGVTKSQNNWLTNTHTIALQDP